MKLGKIADTVWHKWLSRPYVLCSRRYGRANGDPLLLLHGIASSHSVWQPLIKLARSSWRITVPDLLGFGDSPAPQWQRYDTAMHVRHIRAQLRRQGERGPVTIVAHSMGCLLAVRLAHDYPAYVRRLVLFEPPLFADVSDHRLHERLKERYFSVFRYVVAHPYIFYGASGELRRQIAKVAGISMRPETWIPFKRSLENTIMDQRTYDELRDISVPTDILHGRFDFVVVRAGVRQMLAQNQYISLHVTSRTHGVSAGAARDIMCVLNSYRTVK